MIEAGAGSDVDSGRGVFVGGGGQSQGDLSA